MSEERQEPSPREPLPGSRKRGTLTGPPRSRGGRRGRATRPSDPSRPCLNCGDPTPGEYCPTCGQRKVDVQVSVRVLMRDVLEDQFILDRRLPRTLTLLLFRPGRLTVEYVNGRIASYIHPFRLYLVASLLFFLLLSFLGIRLVRTAGVGATDAGSPTAAATPADSGRLAELDRELAEVQAQLADSTLPPGVRTTLELGRNAILVNRDRIGDRSAAAPPPPQPVPAPPAGSGGTESAAGESDAAAPEGGTGAAANAPDSGPGTTPGTVAELFGWTDTAGVTVETGIAAVDSALAGRIRRLGAMEPRQALEEIVGTFLNYVPTLMFLLLPIFALVLKLLYLRRRRFYAEHFVFLLHAHAFVFLILTVMLLTRHLVAGWLALLWLGWVLVYGLLAMKRVYGQGWLKTSVKYWILGWAYFWVLSLALPFAIVATILLF